MGGEEALRIEFTAGEVAYPGLISRLQAEQIDILFIGGYDTETAIIAQQIRAAGLNTQIMGGDTLMSEEFWAIAGEAGQGTLLTYMPDLTIEPAAQLILANFQKNNQPVDGYAAYAYAAVQVFAQAAIKAGSADYNALTDVLNGETFATVLGEVAFDPFGNNTRPGYSVFRWTDGDVLPIQ
jgi:branched-chain amino acid transport system substrate-binding protein